MFAFKNVQICLQKKLFLTGKKSNSMKTGIKLIWIAATVLFLSACVSTKQFSEVQDQLKGARTENDHLKQDNMKLEVLNSGLSDKNSQLAAQAEKLGKQVEDAKYAHLLQQQKAAALRKDLEDLQHQLDVLDSGSSAEIEKLMADLQRTQNNLNLREDKLHEAELELQERNAKLIELQEMLAQKEQAVKALKNKVMAALVGFNNNGLTVHEKNGKVYVSLDEKLLFKTGKWDVDPNGQKALRELAKVLAQNPDINIMVEGHTDDVPMHGSGEVKDNWDLSVMRATAVTKILMENPQIDPVRIIAAGRSEYLPLSPEKTAEGRQINRRTEIILTPNIDELLKLMGE